MKNKKFIFFTLLIGLFICSVVSAGLVETIGGRNADKDYHFIVTEDSSGDGLMTSGSNSRVQLVSEVEVITESTEVLVVADSGKVFVSEDAGVTDYTLPDCASDQLVYHFVAADANVITIDTFSTGDTILWLTLDAGDSIDSAGAIGDSISLQCFKLNTWIPITMSATNWIDGGA